MFELVLTAQFREISTTDDARRAHDKFRDDVLHVFGGAAANTPDSAIRAAHQIRALFVEGDHWIEDLSRADVIQDVTTILSAAGLGPASTDKSDNTGDGIA